MAVELQDYPDHTYNTGILSLDGGVGSFYDLSHNRGTIRVGSYATVFCEFNFGTISIGPASTVLNANYNRGTIRVGVSSTIEIANGQVGPLSLGMYCTLKEMNRNSGTISTDSYCQLPPELYERCTSTGVLSIGSDSSTFVATGVTTPESPAPVTPEPAPAYQTRSPYSLYSSNPSPSPPQSPPRPPPPDEVDSPICFDARVDTAFNCGHLACAQCAQPLYACSICRIPIRRRLHIFL